MQVSIVRYRHVRDCCRQQGYRVQTAVGGQDLQQPAQALARGRQQGVMAFPVKLPHAADMGGEVPFINELCHDRLGVGWHTRQKIAHHGAKGVYQGWRHQQIAQAQRWEKRFAEGADIDHLAVGVHALEGGWWSAAKKKFAVVVILDDPGATLLRRMQQGEAARQAHHTAHRLLVRGGDKGQPESRAQSQRCLHLQALGVHGYRYQIGAASNQAVARTNRSGVLEPHVFTGVEQC